MSQQLPENATAQELISSAIQHFGDSFAVVTSFQREGMVILDMAAKISPAVCVVTLDTGRLPAETHQMMESVRDRYGVRIEAVSPDPAELETMVARYGPNLFYRESALRMLCCQVRKVRPLDRKLAEFKAYAVGLRRTQSETRGETAKVEETGGRLKLSPLADWTNEQVETYIRENGVPVHPLYARGYTSIGCGPCTRATAEGEDERAGRWWWEQGLDKECGLHFTPDGRGVRRLDVLLQEVIPHA